jgi:homoserine O-acetyltransferase
MKPNFFQYDKPFELENGEVLPELTIAYHTYGTLNKQRNNVIWICHALTANSDAQDWWPQMIGRECILDTDECFVICANIIGSCYGTTGPLSIHPKLNTAYHQLFPSITIRDMVNAHELLRKHLFINEIQILIGGSMGGYQAMEWSIVNPTLIKKMVLLSTSAKETAWGIAIHTAQRMAIEADDSFHKHHAKAGENGLAAARAIGMLTYRNYKQFVSTQSDTDNNKITNFKASSYIRHQGQKLQRRFNAYSYHALTLAMDTHNIARGRARKIEDVLKTIQQPTLVFSMKDDMLCPFEEQKFLANHIPNSKLIVLDTAFGHDGFLVETKKIANHLLPFVGVSANVLQ